MSNVFARNRKETELQFFATAEELQIELTKYIMKEKFFPKKWRYLIGQNIISTVDKLLENIVAANTIYPTNETELQIRKNYQTEAIINCYQLQNKIIRMEKCIDTVKIEDLEKVIDLLFKETGLLKNWRKANKIIK